MLGSTFIETAIGLSLLFLMMSLMCSMICEVIARGLFWRERLLFKQIAALVGGPAVAWRLYRHPLIRNLGTAGLFDLESRYRPVDVLAAFQSSDRAAKEATPTPKESTPRDSAGDASSPRRIPATLYWLLEAARRPSNIPADTFARALVDLLLTKNGTTTAPPAPTADTLRAALLDSTNKSLRDSLTALLQDDRITTMEQARAAIAAWFNGAMAPVTERFKRLSQETVFALSLALTVVLNVDTLLVANRLQRDTPLREAVVASAASFAKEHKDLAQGPVGTPAPASTSTPVAPAPSAGTAELPASTADVEILSLQARLRELNLPIGWPTKDQLDAAGKRATEARTAFDQIKPTDAPAKAAAEKALLVATELELGRDELALTGWPALKPEGLSESQKRLRLIGWLLTALAVSLGTRFWFDTLSRLVNLKKESKPDDTKS